MTQEELTMLQSLPLEIKIAKSKLRIEEYVTQLGLENVYVSFSGGKDSTVLLDICRELYPNIKAVFVDTGLEYPEIKQHVNTYDNVEIIRPKLSFKQVLEKYGYPMISKEQSRYIHDVRHSTPKMKALRLSESRYSISKKYRYLIDAPFEISNACCDVMKKRPAKAYEKRTGSHPIIGTMAGESRMRKINYLKYGCNAFDKQHISSTPLGFWTEQDILLYIKEKNLPIPSVYGEVVEDENGILKTTGVHRTGCVFCGYGVHLEKEPNRYQQLEETHPQLHNYCMNKLGFKEVCEYMNIPYTNKEDKD